ncbi:hypothetical protein E2C06_27105 [Dankookia rubra]|uniref:Uncharacterized protein n=1 Tax=Dankookia rubra TaxID=1442381 RepID=A0A4R5QA07_9PROT|nr:hypothetical protein E2C06_27105 [Dankookia rubra]
MHDLAKRVTGSLAGLRVPAVATVIAAPYSATPMSESGADVVKEELPGNGGTTRRFGSIAGAREPLPWLTKTRDKRSLCALRRRAAKLKRATWH